MFFLISLDEDGRGEVSEDFKKCGHNSLTFLVTQWVLSGSEIIIILSLWRTPNILQSLLPLYFILGFIFVTLCIILSCLPQYLCSEY